MPMNNGIVNLLITVTLRDSTSPNPLTPRFQVLADTQETGQGQQSFSCDGLGDNDQGLLKDILRKIISSYPKSPISLCISGPNILPDGQCVAASARLDARLKREPAPPKSGARRRSTVIKAADEKTAPKKTKPKNSVVTKAAQKTAVADKATGRKSDRKPTKAKKTGAGSASRRKPTKKSR